MSGMPQFFGKPAPGRFDAIIHQLGGHHIPLASPSSANRLPPSLGRAIDALPTHRRARLGLGYVSQEREIFSSLTVMENLAVAALPGGWPPDRVFGLFPCSRSAAGRPATG
jgi:hypothetical protein